MARHRRRAGFTLLAVVLVSAAITIVEVAPAGAVTSYSDYVVFGEQGVFVGAGSEIVGLVGARSNNPGYPDSSAAALGMNGGATITGDARVGGNVALANQTTITGTLFRVGSLSTGSGVVIGSDQQVADADLPPASLSSLSVWPGGLGAGCPTGGTSHTGLGNGASLSIAPGSYGAIQGGGGNTLTFNGAGDYFVDSIAFANGLTIQVPVAGVRVFVCSTLTTGSGLNVLPTSLKPGGFSWEVAALGVAANQNAFRSAGTNWIGNVLVPTRGLKFGTGSGPASWRGYMWADHIDIEHGVVTTRPPRKSGVKWWDHDGNGIRDPGDEGLSGWTIFVDYNGNGQLDAGEPSAESGAGGFYEITDIDPGTWKVREVAQAGWTCTFPQTVDQFGCYHEETFTNGGNFADNDFGNFRERGHKSGTKFEDLDGDGTRDPDEPGIEGWPIHLYLAPEFVTPFASTTTDPDGSYRFSDLEPGDYRVCEAAVAGWAQTFPTGSTIPPSGESITDQCPVPNVYGYDFTVTGGERFTGDDFGNQRRSSKSGTKFDDLDGDGTRDPDEPGVEGWPILLFKAPDFANPLSSTVTDGFGDYSFTDLAPGAYRVCEGEVAGWIQTSPNTNTTPPAGETLTDQCPAPNVYGYEFTIATDEAFAGNDFGNFKPVRKSGTKFEDTNGNGTRDPGELGLAGWTIRVYRQDNGSFSVFDSTTTDADGDYVFDLFGPGTYLVCEVLPAGWTQTYPTVSTPDPAGEEIVPGCDPPEGTRFGYRFTATSGRDLAGNDFGNFEKVTKSGLKWEDRDGDGDRDAGDDPLAGWPVELYKQGNGSFALEDTTTTDTNGGYSFGPLGPGTYRVCEGAVAGWVQTYPNAQTPDPIGEAITDQCPSPNVRGYEFTVTSGTDLAGDDFGNFEQVTKSGLKWDDRDGDGERDAGDDPIPGWPITLYQKQLDGTFLEVGATTTDTDGEYSFGPLGPGTYRVCEAAVQGFTQTHPNVSTPDPSGEQITDQCPAPNTYGYQFRAKSGRDLDDDDFGNHRESRKAGLKFDDTDGDGTRDPGEPGLAGWTITLAKQDDQQVFQPVGSTLTDSNGGYGFGPLGPGTYRVCEAATAGWVQTRPFQGMTPPAGETITDQCPEPNVYGYEFTVETDEAFAGNDFGNFQRITKSGTKFEDTDGDGTRDPGEPGLAGWTIRLYDANGVEVQSTVTDADGSYAFEPLGPGTYTVCEVLESGWVQTYPNAQAPDPPGEEIVSNCAPPDGTAYGYRFMARSGIDLTGDDFGNRREAPPPPPPPPPPPGPPAPPGPQPPTPLVQAAAVTPVAVSAAQVARLAVTGPGSEPLGLVGALFLVNGLLALAVRRRPTRRSWRH